jgi:hypothetical protein
MLLLTRLCFLTVVNIQCMSTLHGLLCEVSAVLYGVLMMHTKCYNMKGVIVLCSETSISRACIILVLCSKPPFLLSSLTFKEEGYGT